MDWYEYSVTTRSGPGQVERPAGDGWDLVGTTSTFVPAGTVASVPGATPARVEHHAWWKRRAPGPAKAHAPLGASRAPAPPKPGERG